MLSPITSSFKQISEKSDLTLVGSSTTCQDFLKRNNYWPSIAEMLRFAKYHGSNAR